MTLLEVMPQPLQIVWFVLIAVLWLGYLVLEGFDYGVAMLLPVLGKKDEDRRVMINTIGPVWDGNEVWLLTAGGATFAAFPGWYATLFSGLYLPLFLVLAGLIIRGIAFEYRAKRPETTWKNRLDWCATIGSFIVSLVWGVGFANFVVGLPVDANHIYVGGFWALFGPFQLIGGVLAVLLFATHGAIFIALKTLGSIREDARNLAIRLALITLGVLAVFLIWQNAAWGTGVTGWILAALALAGMAGAWVAAKADREGFAFLGTTVATLMLFLGIFVRMYPNLGFDNSLTQGNPLDIVTASSTPMTLQIMTIAAIVFVPIVLAYQAWSYWVFRKRISTKHLPKESAVH